MPERIGLALGHLPVRRLNDYMTIAYLGCWNGPPIALSGVFSTFRGTAAGPQPRNLSGVPH